MMGAMIQVELESKFYPEMLMKPRRWCEGFSPFSPLFSGVQSQECE
jgi:hypothetical protein